MQIQPNGTDDSADVVCPICQCPIETGEKRGRCPECHTVYHADCWKGNKGCAVYGCTAVPKTEKRSELEIPVSYWGEKNKPCPSCRREILASALRCRYCGARFESAAPQTAAEFRGRRKLNENTKDIRKKSVFLFIFNVLTLTAPIAWIVGLFWYYNRRDAIIVQPAIYRTLAIFGIIAGFSQTILIVMMTTLFALTRG